jgi:hypothetical protein
MKRANRFFSLRCMQSSANAPKADRLILIALYGKRTSDKRLETEMSTYAVMVTNLLLIVLCLGVFLTNQLFWKSSSDSWVLHNYLNDAIAMILLLSFSNFYISLCNNRFERPIALIVTPCRVSALVIVAGVYWEYIAPLYTSLVSDVADVAAYAIGGALYYGLARASKRIAKRLAA